MECMLMLSPLSVTVCGGIGVITPMDGDGIILIMVGVAILIMAVMAAGLLAGEASTAAGDTIIIIIPAAVGMPVADTGEATTGIAVVHIQTDVTQDRAPQRLLSGV